MSSPALQRVGFLGPEGTNTHTAAQNHFGDRARFLSEVSIPAVFDSVARGAADYGVVPIENSIEGGVSFTLEALLDTPLRLCGETIVDIEHCLLSRATDLGTITRVLSHPQALAQCRHWLARHLPHAAQAPSLSTSQAALDAAKTEGTAAIASEAAGHLAGLPIVARAIQDRKPNATRFIVLGMQCPPPTGVDKTSLVFSTPHRRGALCRALSLFDQQGINLTRIESRPKPGAPWEYNFFVDLEGHQDDRAVSEALQALRTLCDEVKVLGSYPRAR